MIWPLNQLNWIELNIFYFSARHEKANLILQFTCKVRSAAAEVHAAAIVIVTALIQWFSYAIEVNGFFFFSMIWLDKLDPFAKLQHLKHELCLLFSIYRHHLYAKIEFHQARTKTDWPLSILNKHLGNFLWEFALLLVSLHTPDVQLNDGPGALRIITIWMDANKTMGTTTTTTTTVTMWPAKGSKL